MKNFLITMVMVITVLPVTSCGAFFPGSGSRPSNSEVFDSFWSIIDERYVFFSLKGVDWQASYDNNCLYIDEAMSTDDLWTILTSMLVEFNDGHLNLIRENGWWSIFNIEGYLPDTRFSLDLVKSSRLPEFEYKEPMTYGLMDSVGYVHISNFRTLISGYDADTLVDFFRDTRGLIIDIRDNSGGNATYGNNLQSRFIETRIHIEDLFSKEGPGHDQFSDPRPIYLDPSGSQKYLDPIVVLTNGKSFSAASFFASRMSVLPKVTLIGTPTGGGGSPESQKLPNGWSLRYPAFFSQSPDSCNFESGVPVDHLVDMDEIDIENGTDTQLEYAIRFLTQ